MAPLTPSADINAVLSALLLDAYAVLGNLFEGMYLSGSLASGDFNPQTSDIDFVVVTDGEIPPEKILVLAEMHERLWAGADQPGCAQQDTQVSQAVAHRHRHIA